jgi:hypothetical protein
MAFINHERLTEITRRISEVAGVKRAGLNESTRILEVAIGKTKDLEATSSQVIEIATEYGINFEITEEA